MKQNSIKKKEKSVTLKILLKYHIFMLTRARVRSTMVSNVLIYCNNRFEFISIINNLFKLKSHTTKYEKRLFIAGEWEGKPITRDTVKNYPLLFNQKMN